MKTKLAIQTLKLSTNYGGILQAFALQYFLEKRGAEVIHLRMYEIPKPIILRLKLIAHTLRYRKLRRTVRSADNVFSIFISKYIKLAPHVTSLNEWRDYIHREDFNAVVVGSDQVWRLDYINAFVEGYFLDFLKGKTKKIAYAASLGRDSFDSGRILAINEMLQDFDAVSLREQSGVQLFADKLNIKAEHVVDPTLLLTQKEYIDLFALEKKSEGKKLFCYVLDKASFKLEIINKVKSELDLPDTFVYGVEVTKENYKDKDLSTKVSVEQWLQNFYNAEFVITDSFHGMIFSIIFNKPFLVIANEHRGVARFTSLLDLLNLRERLVFNKDNFDESLLRNSIDYGQVNEIIRREKDRAVSFFNNVLNG